MKFRNAFPNSFCPEEIILLVELKILCSFYLTINEKIIKSSLSTLVTLPGGFELQISKIR